MNAAAYAVVFVVIPAAAVSVVIPANAGIHFAVVLAFIFKRKSKIKVEMDPGFRRDDEQKQKQARET